MAVLISFLFVCDARATTYYIDNVIGNDQSSGLSTSASWKTIGKANATLRAGDTVYLRAGTYNERLVPSNSGTSGAKITYRNYNGESVLVRGVSGQTAVASISRAHITLDGLSFKHISPGSVSSHREVLISGDSADSVTVRNCTMTGQGTASLSGGKGWAIEVAGGDYALLENNTISGYFIIGIRLTGASQYCTIRGNTLYRQVRSNIDFYAGNSGPFYCLVENNLIDFSLCEDGIQFEQNYSEPAPTDTDSNRHVVIRGNVIRNSQENPIDLKGAAYILIENNLIYGSPGNNDGGLGSDGNTRYPSASAIVYGSTAGSRDCIIRGNVLYDNHGGILLSNGYKIYHNTILYNNRDYTGSNTSYVTTNRPAVNGIAGWNGRSNTGIKNNILGGHNAADISIAQTSPSLTIDGNLYFGKNGGSAKLVKYAGSSSWSLVSWSNWSAVLANPILALGDDLHGVQGNPRFVNVPGDLTGSHEKFDFDLQSGSPAIDAGRFLTATTASGSGTTLPVADASYFTNGYGVTAGDLIQLQGQSARTRVVAVNASTGTLTLQSSLTWTKGQGVALAYEGTAPDIGAREYAGTSTTTYSLSTSASNGTITRTPNQTSYAPGTTVTLQATANSGYTFSGWSGDLTGTTNPATLVMDADKSVTANFTASTVTYTLTTSATNGTIMRTPDQTSYASGETVTLQATANSGYTFSGWSGDLTGTTNPATLVMNSDKSAAANFTAKTYTLAVSAAHGSVSRNPDKASYSYGEAVTLQAVPDTGYTFSGWSGATSGTTNPTVIIMNDDKSVTANFIVSIVTYVLSVSTANGSVVKTPDKSSYTSGETVTLQAVPNTGYTFSNWSGDVSGTGNPVTVTMDSYKMVVANFAAKPADQLPPALGDCSPAPDSIQAPRNTLVVLNLRDEGEGIDAASVSIHVDGALVYTGDVDTHRTAHGVCHRSGTKADYTYTYQQLAPYGCSREVLVIAQASDLAGNVMPEQTYSFATEMHAFGASRSISTDQTGLHQGRPATVGDAQGNLWMIWHAGSTGARHIYATRLRADTDTYSGTVQVSQGTGDHCNPAVALDSTGTLHVVWQENTSGVWDVCASTSVDGETWSPPQRIADPTGSQSDPAVNRTHPAIAAGRQSGNLVAIAWQEDRAGNQDICVASSTNAFATTAVSRVTSDAADQSDPAVAIDDRDTIFVLWTDARNGSGDIYGAASDSGPWANGPVVDTGSNQSHPAVAAGSSAGTLYVAWVDDAGGDLDIFHAVSEGLPTGSVAGVNIIDDTSGADQEAPAIAVASGGDGTDRIFICWEDGRNVAYSGDVDLYFADVSTGSLPANVLVDGNGAHGNLREAALGTDWTGHPYVAWADDAGKSVQLYCAGATYANPVPLAEQEIIASSGGIVGTPPESVATLDDVSVVVPPAVCPFSATISIARIWNPQGFATESLRHYEFGPSGLTFAEPVIITIPYPSGVPGKLKAYWFDSATGTFSEQGVTEVQDISLGRGRKALQFKTTHFTPFYLVSADVSDTTNHGGGCSLAVHEEGNPVGYLIPYLLLVAVMGGLRLVDAKRHSGSSRRENGCSA